MKKLAKIFAVVLVCALAVTALVACAPKPNTNYDEAKKNLKDKEYTVVAVKAGDIGAELVIAGAIAGVEGVKVEDVEAYLSGSKLELEDSFEGDIVKILWFKNSDAANKFYEASKKDWDENKQEQDEKLAAMQEKIDKMDDGAEKDKAQKDYDALKEYMENSVIGKSGNIVYKGTKAGIEATK